MTDARAHRHPSMLARVLVFFDSERRSRTAVPPGAEDRVEWLRLLPFAVMHLGCLAPLFVGVSPVAVWTCVALYALRMFAVTAFYHRYLSHRAFEAPRWLVFLGALGATAAAQRGPLWWAAHHRVHHRFTDQLGDVHSPGHRGFWWSHIGWFTTRRGFRTDHSQVRDLMRYPELRWLDRFDIVVPLLLLALLGVAGAVLARVAPDLGTSSVQMMAWGFCVSTTLLFHATSAVNSLGHLFGSRPYPSPDQSRNSLLLSLVTFGEGWHNNHHWCPSSVRQGFRWWQLDVSFYVLWLLSRIGLVRLRPLPARARRAGHKVSK